MMHVLTFGAAATSFALGLAGCAPTHQARSAAPAGFLGDYSQLREGKEGEALLVYRNPSAQWRKYDKVLIEPVTVWDDALRSGLLRDVPPDETQVLGPGVMRCRVAITEAEGSAVVLDVASAVIPQLRALSVVKRVATGT